MKIKKTKFSIFRYQLLPNESSQYTIFDQLTRDELVENKNDFFKDVVINEKNNYQGKGVKIRGKIEYVNDYDIILKIGVEKSKEINKVDFTKERIKDYPNVAIYINNRKDNQFLIIENNFDAFSDINTVAKILGKAWNHKLINNRLSLYIEQTFNENEFWDTINEYEPKGITSLRFEFIRPNISDISGKIKEVLPAIANTVNGHITNFNINAPNGGTLENITPQNNVIEALLSYNREGGGPPPSLKVKGYRQTIKTVKSEKTFSIDEFEGTFEQFTKLINLRINA